MPLLDQFVVHRQCFVRSIDPLLSLPLICEMKEYSVAFRNIISRRGIKKKESEKLTLSTRFSAQPEILQLRAFVSRSSASFSGRDTYRQRGGNQENGRENGGLNASGKTRERRSREASRISAERASVTRWTFKKRARFQRLLLPILRGESASARDRARLPEGARGLRARAKKKTCPRRPDANARGH